MRTETDSSLVTVARREFVELPEGRITRLHCVSGLLWVTEHGRSGDLVLRPGQSHTLEGGRSGVIQALQPSTLRLHPQQPQPLRPTRRNAVEPQCKPDIGDVPGAARTV